jgi:hypothetical protein
MLKAVETFKTSSVQRLIGLWAKRYTPDLSSVSLESFSYKALREAASPEGRALTSAKLKDNVLNINCQMAWIQTKILYGYIPNIIDLNEARRITLFAFRVYKKILEIYEKYSLNHIPPTAEAFESNDVCVWGIPAIEELAYALEPILLVFQEQHIVSKDWRALGFMTTQLNFSNKLILKKLTAFEQVLLAPYLKFVEEQVAIPWQRICAAAANYEIDSPELKFIEQMIQAAPEIAENIYRQLVELLPNHRSRRGELSDPDVTYSCLRDLNMFQAYLWLCLLEKSMTAMEEELLPLCAMVVQGVSIKWEMTEKWSQLFVDEIISRVNAEQKALLLPYLQGMQEMFWRERSHLGYKEQVVDSVV